MPSETKSLPDVVDLRLFLEDDCFECGGDAEVRPVRSEVILEPVDAAPTGKRPLLHLSRPVVPALNQSL